ncbi:energy transducer TonB [Geothrix terrae]|uniref:energy transducer TonB n=1 Tax=Geothrix terrae TaxID=2922720 RepID=UPI001FAD1431|nr:energy transducer TonB [Geothrix terrae]
MKRCFILTLAISLGCTPPKTNDQKISLYTDFSQIRVIYQPPAPPYPLEAKVAGIQGTVVVQLTVDTKGIPYSAIALEGPIELRQTAEAYALKWKFAPCTLNGVPQYARFKLSMPFRLRMTNQAK